jgi:UDP-glucose 4-epimerase
MTTYLITGGGGFIGSHLAHALSQRGDVVRVLDDFSTGNRHNLAGAEGDISVLEGSMLDRPLVEEAMRGVDVVLHQAALPSVPRSVADPWTSNRINVEGSLNIFLAARDAGVRRVVYASSSSVYGNAAQYPVDESLPRQPLSPYAVSKAAVEQYATSFAMLYGMQLVGLRYFNVFGPRQDPDSPYAAVIPRFLQAMLAGHAPIIYGDGTQARDFTSVRNVVSANLLAADASGELNGVYNIACGKPVSLLELFAALNESLSASLTPEHHPRRDGDILMSWASIDAAREAFGYTPDVSFDDGLRETVDWYRAHG